MYQIDDLIIYEHIGVCRIMDITVRHLTGIDQEHLYYVLAPLYQNCTIFVPTDTTKVFIRPIISKEEAERLIDKIPSIRIDLYHNVSMNQLTEHYKATLKRHDCSELLKLYMSIDAKKQVWEQQNRKLGAVDEKFMKRAEYFLFGEIAAALNIDKEDVPAYIAGRINIEGRCKENETN